MAVKAGFKAGDIELKNQADILINTKDFKGKKLLLSFHPMAWTSVCAKQMQSLEDNFEKFEELNTVPLGISIDHAPCKKAWAASLGIEQTDLLCDFWPTGAIAKKFGVFLEKFGFSERVNFILDEKREVIFSKVYPVKEVPEITEIIEFLEGTEK